MENITPQQAPPRGGLLASAPNVRLNTALWRFWRAALLPINIGCAAIAGAHFRYFSKQREIRERS